MSKYVLINPTNQKSINVWDDTSHPGAWDNLGGTAYDVRVDIATRAYYGKVAWLWRGVNLVAQSVAALPYVYQSPDGEVLEDGAPDWLPDPARLVRMLCLSRQLTGRGYLYRQHNKFDYTTAVRYMSPLTIEPVYDRATGELLSFRRSYSSNDKIEHVDLPLSSVVYSWYSDPYVEHEPPVNYPARAALHAAGVLSSVDEFMEGYFKRGAIRATLLAVEHGTKPERDRLERWFNRFINGINNAWRSKVIQAGAVTPVTVGDGLEALDEKNLSRSKREDIAAALGIPQTKLFSGDASGLGGGGVAGADEIAFMQQTVLPEAREILAAINQQALGAEGVRLAINEAAVDVLQADEHERATSLVNLTNALHINPAAALASMELLGFELTHAQRDMIERMTVVPAAQPETVAAPVREDDKAASHIVPVAPAQIIADYREANAEISKWQRHALRVGALRSADEFVNEVLPEETADYITAALREIGDDRDDIKALFSAARVMLERGELPSAALTGAMLGALEKTAPADVFGAVANWEGYP